MDTEGFFMSQDSNADVPMPVGEQETTALLSKKDISVEVSKEYVGTALIEEEDSFTFPMFLIKANKIDGTYQFVLSALKSLIVASSETAIYKDIVPVYMLNQSNTILKLGEGSFHRLYFSLNSFIQNTLGPKCKVLYYDENGNKQKIGSSYSNMILDI